MKITRLRLLIGLAFIVVLGGILGIRVSHPHGGLSNGLGSASSGIVLYEKGSSTNAGTKVIIGFSKPHVTPVLGVITGNQKASVIVQTGKSLENIQASQIQGRLLLVIPFLGSILNVIGL